MEKTFCEFFAGIGLVHEALRAVGGIAGTPNDIDAKKRRMYEGHYGPSPHYHEGDVWAVDEVLERIEKPPFLTTASFPCTDMSLAGKRRGLAGQQSGTLLGFLQVVERLPERPRVVLLENVPGFITSHGGKDFATAVDELASLGYRVDSFVLDAKWFVPQSRPRLFLLGYHMELDSPALVARNDEPLTLGDPWRSAIDRADRLRPAPLRRMIESLEPLHGWATVDVGNPLEQSYVLADYLDADDEQPWWEAPDVARHEAMLSDRHRLETDKLRRRGGSKLLTAFRRIRQGQQRMEVRFDGVAGCLRTPRGGSAKQIVVLVRDGELQMRWMTPREYARLQGAPDFTLPENTIQALFGFGDAVCVPVIEWIDRNMLTPVFEGMNRGPAGANTVALAAAAP